MTAETQPQLDPALSDVESRNQSGQRVAAIMVATPQRSDRPDFRAVVFALDGVAEVSPRMSYGDALAYARARDAAIQLDEHAQREKEDQPLNG